jgi:DNA-binding NtrC family response regulator
LNFNKISFVQPEETRVDREKIPARVLVVDDEPLIRWAAATSLSDAGFTVVEAADVAGARRLMATPFDVALLDFRLPDGDGVTLMSEIHEAQPECRFIMMTAFRTAELTARAARDRVAVLEKPFGMPDLVGLVNRVVARQG